VLSREDFGPTTRDPFQAFIGLDDKTAVEAPVVPILRQRDVKLAEYDFGDLTLIAIVRSPRGVRPRALFRATDGKSKTIQQGEYFSRAEVLLASVNRDYVEIEIVDEELAKSLGLARGETRAIYLKKE
jgi:Tfp pilus assembly protein PilP